ncbi:glycosyltransferase family A protein [Polaribacter sp.]|uniref:glycosyltransferase family A protein n=1 Tax=Polaribacter sp. TaxID=1920175 RepID=UPI003F6A5708
MHSGIIIIFNNDEQTINTNPILDFLDKNNFKVCLVNNASTDNTIDALNKIKLKANTSDNIFIVDNSRNKGLKYAVKAGARFLLNEAEFENIIYLESNTIFYLKHIEEYFSRLELQKEILTKYQTRSDRNVLNNVFPFKELIKINDSI